jgi:hypothetical protein
MIFWAGVIGFLLGEYIWRVMKGRQIIRDANNEAYLIRYFIWKPDWLRYIGINPKKAGRIYLHHILRSDHDRALHCHPWSFLSVVLKGGYREYTHLEDVSKFAGKVLPRRVEWKFVNWPLDRRHLYSKDMFKFGKILFRPAAWRHRLELEDGKTAWTLVFIGPKVRDWGFWPGGKFCPWKRYDTANGICEEPEVTL